MGCLTVNASVQVAPLTAHSPLFVSQVAPAAQSPSLAQVNLHAPALHAYGAQLLGTGTEQPPALSQVPGGVSESPVQDDALHWVDVPGRTQALGFAPSHWPTQAPVPAHAGFGDFGAPARGLHWPTLPVSAQLSHWPVHGESQQTPSTQKLDVHWLAAWQALPLSILGTQNPPWQ